MWRIFTRGAEDSRAMELEIICSIECLRNCKKSDQKEQREREESERGERLQREPHLSLRKNDPEEAVSECGPDSKAVRGHWKLVRYEAKICGVREAARTRVNRARVMTVLEWSGDSVLAQDHGKKNRTRKGISSQTISWLPTDSQSSYWGKSCDCFCY